jgi:maleylacetate reductase
MPAAWTHTALAQQIVFGDGAVARLPELIRAIGARRALLVTTPGRAASPEGEQLVRTLGRTLVSTFADAAPHVPAPVVQQALLQARRDAVDVVVSFGGGSCADLGKAVCFFLEQEAGMPGASHADRPAVAHVSVPTTYSGAELTPFFGMTDPGTGQKQGAGGPTSAPLVAVYDPSLTLGTPARVSAETGMNALAHCVEAAWSTSRTPEAEAIALAGAAAIGRWLPAVVEQPDDLEARTGMLEAACLAGRCLQNAGMGVHHGLAQLLGGRTRLPHGLLNAVLLAHSVRFNEPAAPEAVARLGAALGAEDGTADAIDRLRTTLGLPGGLEEAGVNEDDLAVVARLSQSSHAVASNPRLVSEADALEVLRAAW